MPAAPGTGPVSKPSSTCTPLTPAWPASQGNRERLPDFDSVAEAAPCAHTAPSTDGASPRQALNAKSSTRAPDVHAHARQAIADGAPRADTDPAAHAPRTRSATFYKQRATERYTDYGVTLGRTVAGAPPFPPPVREPASDIDKQPVATVEWRDGLSPEEEFALQKELIYFRSRLCAEDRDAFDSTRRLTPTRREELLKTLSPEQRAERGLRFADEPSPFVDSPRHADIRSRPSVPTPARSRPRAQVILMDLWFVACPLQLDAAVDAIVRGINVSYNGPYSTRTARNMTRTTRETKAMRDAIDGEVEAGRMCGYFAEPPFPVYRVIPLGTVPKKGTDELRPVDNYSVFKQQGINALSDDVVVPSRRLAHVIEAIIAAGPDVHFVKWDIDKAYQLNAVRPQDHWLTVAEVPERGFCYRPYCPFGLKTSGFRFEATGRIISILYTVFQHRMSYNHATQTVTTHPPMSHFRTDDERDPLWDPPPEGHGAFTDSDGGFIHPIGAERLCAQAETVKRVRAEQGDQLMEPPMANPERFVDDFLRCCANVRAAMAVAAAVLYVHARTNIRLKKSKFEFVRRVTDFRGYDIIAPHTLSLPSDKRTRMLAVLQSVDRDHVSLDALEVAIGVFIFMMGVFPQLRGLLSPIYRVLHRDPALRSRGERHRRKPLFPMSSEARKCIWMLRAVTRDGPAASSAHLRSDTVLATQPQAVMHTDWGYSADRKRQGWGIYNITDGSYVQMRVPEHFAKWCRAGKKADSSPALEAFAWVVMIRTYGEDLSNCVVTVFSDNMPAVQAYHRCYYGYLSDSVPLASALRQLAYYLIRFNVVMCLEYVPTNNNLADPLSRFDLQSFVARLGSLGLSPTPSARSPPSMATPTW